MDRFIALLLLLAAALCLVAALATGYNLTLIAMRPETISVVNVMVAQVMLIGVLLALARLCARRGLRRWASAARRPRS